ncbi:hypothetical protein Tco_0603085 [Tanacetum coccineum]
MTLNEYLQYKAEMERRLRGNARSKIKPSKYEGADINSFHQDKSKAFDYPYYHEDIEIKKCYELPPLLPFPQPIHTTPTDDAYVVTDTNLILDELLEEFRDEILNITVIDEEADFNVTIDIKELECQIATDHESSFTEIKKTTARRWKFEITYACGYVGKKFADYKYDVVTNYALVLVFLAAIQVDASGVVLGWLLAARKPFKPD